MDECEKEMYTLICSKRFDSIDTKQDKILNILEGANGDAGLCEQVRNNTKFNKALIGVSSTLSLIIFIQFVAWIRTTFF